MDRWAVQLPAEQDPVAPVGGARPGPGRCGFCACELGGDGEVLKTSARAKELVKLEDTKEKIEAELVAARARLAEVEGQLAAAVAQLQQLTQSLPAPAAERRGLHFEG